MGAMFSVQGNVPPATANSLTSDGEGMHSYLSYDMVRGLNNLGTYVNNHWHYVQAYVAIAGSAGSVNGRAASTWFGAAREAFLIEIPVFVPLWAKRMVWAVGARCVAISQSAVTVYLSREPYTGARDLAFNTALLSTGGYRSRSVNVSLTSGQYSLADDSTTGITPIDDTSTKLVSPGVGLNTKRKGYVIVTANGGVNATVAVEDCSFWFLPS